MDDESALHRLVGLADAFELLSAATAFPGDELVRAVTDGALASDARGCLEDAAGEEPGGVDDDGCARWEALTGLDAGELAHDLRRGHSLLHLRQGSGVAVWPYESAFDHVRMGLPGEPALFRTHVTLAVEESMRQAGVQTQDRLTEPCDSVWNECAFLSFLLGSEASALAAGDEGEAGLWRGRTRAFARDHALAWLPGFFAQVGATAESCADMPPAAREYYGALGAYGRRVLDLLGEHAGK